LVQTIAERMACESGFTASRGADDGTDLPGFTQVRKFGSDLMRTRTGDVQVEHPRDLADAEAVGEGAGEMEVVVGHEGKSGSKIKMKIKSKKKRPD
jgi:hypothetical protein